MSEILTQDEIDALTQLHFNDDDGPGDSGSGGSENLEKFVKIFSESTKVTLSTLLSHNIQMGTPEIIEKSCDELISENTGPYVISQILLEGSVQGPFLLALNQKDSTIVVDLILMGSGDAKEDFTAEDEDAFTEAVNQVLGAFTVSVKESFSSGVGMNQSEIFALEFSDPSCPIQSLGEKQWKLVKIPFKIEGLVDTHLFLIFPEVTVNQIENVIDTPEIPTEPPIPTVDHSSPPGNNTAASSPNTPAPNLEMILPRNIAILMDVEMVVSVRVGETEMTLQEILKLGSGSVIELNKPADYPLELMVNNKRIAFGEVVVMDANFALRLTEIETPLERIKKLG